MYDGNGTGSWWTSVPLVRYRKRSGPDGTTLPLTVTSTLPVLVFGDLAVFEGCHLQIALGLLVAGGHCPAVQPKPLVPVVSGVPSAARNVPGVADLAQVMNAGVPASPFLAVIAPPSNC